MKLKMNLLAIQNNNQIKSPLTAISRRHSRMIPQLTVINQPSNQKNSLQRKPIKRKNNRQARARATNRRTKHKNNPMRVISQPTNRKNNPLTAISQRNNPLGANKQRRKHKSSHGQRSAGGTSKCTTHAE